MEAVEGINDEGNPDLTNEGELWQFRLRARAVGRIKLPLT
jgi:hypothetical protein